MQIEALKVFCDVARHRSFSLAAQAYGVTQSAASQVVSQLEKRMGGVQLIDRSTRPLQLTPLGKRYYEGCRVLLDQYQELESSIRTAGAQLAGTVQVAAIYSVLTDMEQYVHRFLAAQPTTRVLVEYLHPDQVYERVTGGAADLGIVSFPRRSPKLVTLPWRDEEMMLVCSPVHGLASLQAVSMESLMGEKYVHFTRDLLIRKKVDQFLREQGVPVEVVHEFDNIESIKKDVELGSGVALLPEPSVRREVQALTLVARPLQGLRMMRPVGIIHRRQNKLSGTAQRFIALLRADYPSTAQPTPEVAPRRRRGRPAHTTSNGAPTQA